MSRRARQLGAVYVLGSVVTLLVALVLWERHRKAAAVAVLVASPFPCPTGLPC